MALRFSRRRMLVALSALSVPMLAACGGAGSPTAAPSTSKEAATPATGATKPAAAGATTAATPGTAATKPAAAASGAGTPAAAATPAAVAKTGSGGTLTIAELTALAKTLHPYPDSASYTSNWSDAMGYIYNGSLLTLDANTLEYRTDMAKEMKVSDDGKTFTFTLRDDLKWSDGSPVTVEDFTFAYEQAKNEENAFVGLEDVQRITSFTAPDAKTIVVALDQVYARDVALGVANTIGPVPKKVWQGKAWNDPAANPEILNPTVVLGPYKPTEFKQAERAVLDPVTTHWDGKPSLDQIILRPGQQPTVAYELLKSGQAQWAPSIPPSQYSEAKNNPDLTMLEWTPANAAYRTVEFNLARPFLQDKTVREAIARALNRKDVIQLAENNLGTETYSFINANNTKWYNPNVEKYSFELARAKSLLQEAGYTLDGGTLKGKDGQPAPKLAVLWPQSSSPRGKIATYMQQQLKQLGIELDLRGLDFSAYVDQVSKQKDYDISLGTWGGGSPDPDQSSKALYLSDGQQNHMSYKNEQVDKLFKDAAVEQDTTKRKGLYDEIQQLVVNDLPVYYFYTLLSFSPISKKLQGVTPNKLDDLGANRAYMKWWIA